MNINTIRFGTPGMGPEAETVYDNAYGDNGMRFVQVLRESPFEIAILSRLITCLELQKKGGG